MERARAWDESKAKENADISRVNAESRERAREEAKARARGKIMLFRGQHQRLPPISEPMRRPREQRERGHRLRQGTRLRLIPSIRTRRQGSQGRKGRR